MSWLRFFAAMLLFALTIPAASAEDWKVLSLQGTGRAFAGGEWTTLEVGETPPNRATLRTGTDGRLVIGREGDVLSVAAISGIDIESDEARELVRVFDGAMGVVERDAPGKRFLVMTSSASLVPRGAEFGVVADATGAVVTVRSGLVEASDLATRRTVEVRAGQTFRALVGRAGVVEKTEPADPALQAAKDAAERASSETGEAASAASGLDRIPTGAIPAGSGKADAKLVEDAANAVHEQRVRAKLGKADPRAVAAVERMERDLFQEIDVETEPWKDDFKWTETDAGEVVLKPISRIVAGLQGTESYEFWVLFILVCLILGGMTNAVLQEAGFGSLCNAVIVMTAFVAAVLVRDLFFRAGSNLALEPFLSMGMMLAAMPVLLLSGAFAKMRWDL
jgi:hypothetical protein